MDLKDIKEFARKIVPLAPVVGGLLGGPAGAAVGTGIQALLGKELTSVSEAEFVAMEKNPEIMVKLREIALAELTITLEAEKAMRHDDTDVEKEWVNSDDSYTSRTRPMLLRRLFWLLAALSILQQPIVITSLASFFAIDQATLNGIMTNNATNEIFFYVAVLFGSSFGGYTLVRSVFDKKDVSRPEGRIGGLIGLLGGKK